MPNRPAGRKDFPPILLPRKDCIVFPPVPPVGFPKPLPVRRNQLFHGYGLRFCLGSADDRTIIKKNRLDPSHTRRHSRLITFVYRSEERRVGKECRSGW